MVEFIEIICPYCWENFSISAEPETGDGQEWVIDCEICCRPVRVVLTMGEDGQMHTHVRAENE